VGEVSEESEEEEEEEEERNSSANIMDTGAPRPDTIEYILNRHIGGSGPWQWRLVAATYPVAFASGYPLLIHMMSTYAPAHRCRVDVCEEVDSAVHAEWTAFALPKQTVLKEIVTGGEGFDQCRRYAAADPSAGCTADNFLRDENATACGSYIYDHSEFSRTLTTDLDLVCDVDNQLRLLGTNMMAGMMIGSLLGGKLGDRFGRKKVMFGALSLIGPALIAAGFASSFWMYAALQLVWCTCLPIIWVSSHSLTLEMFDAKSRIPVICIKDLFYPSELMIMCLVSYLLKDWSIFQFVSGAICLLPLAMWPFIPGITIFERSITRAL